jgi:hypothetical protein
MEQSVQQLATVFTTEGQELDSLWGQESSPLMSSREAHGITKFPIQWI